jgi:hypothetical protein
MLAEFLFVSITFSNSFRWTTFDRDRVVILAYFLMHNWRLSSVVRIYQHYLRISFFIISVIQDLILIPYFLCRYSLYGIINAFFRKENCHVLLRCSFCCYFFLYWHLTNFLYKIRNFSEKRNCSENEREGGCRGSIIYSTYGICVFR